ncbi:MAG: ribosome silencing factor [Bacteroidales bacterium]|jgi:ribosome-associated protein|nr:ribosome silencing factor [Bacteroidales bacterium]
MAKNNLKELIEVVVEGIQQNKGKKIVSVDLSNINNAEVSGFVICEGDSSTHVSSIADSVVSTVKKSKVAPVFGKDGYDNAEWIVIDVGAIFVHVFQPDVRRYYNIEELWADCPVKTYND